MKKKLHSILGIVAVASALLASVSVVFAAPNKLPVVNTFTLAASASSPIPVLAFTAADSDGTVVGYMCNDTSTKPLATDSYWTAAAPATCSTTKSGSVIMYGWAKDNAGGVSAGKTFTTLVPGTPAHVIADVQGLQTALDGKAALAHDHDAVYQKKYGKVAVVAQTGGDFTDPVIAMDSIATWCGTPSSDNPCLLKIMPGNYNIGSSFHMSPFIDVEGSGENVTRIVGNIDGTGLVNGLIYGASDSEIRFLTLENTAFGFAVVIKNDNASPKITNVTLAVSSSYSWGMVNYDGVAKSQESHNMLITLSNMPICHLN